MSHNGNEVPRRAMDPVSDGPDDTPEVETTLARRGPLIEPESPFARPSGPAEAPPPVAPEPTAAPIDPEPEPLPSPPSAPPTDDTPAVPRRSATSTTSASDIDMIPAPAPKPPAEAATAPAPGEAPAPAPGAAPGVASGAAQVSAAASDAKPHTWWHDHRRTLLIWLIGAVIVALAVAVGAFALRGGGQPAVSPTASPSVTQSAAQVVTEADLLTPEDATQIVPDVSWVVTATATTSQEATARAACLSATDEKVNTLETLQRTLGTSDSGQLAALHQLDVYSTVEAAQSVQATRVAALAACSEVPARIVSATAIGGIADEAQQLTIAYDDDPVQFHTVVLLRTGRVLSILDVTRSGEPVSAETAAAGLVRSLTAVCTPAEGTCPATPTFAATVPPSVDPAGWLTTSDFPRVTAGAGKWTSTAPGPVTSHGLGCENLTLSTEAGPIERQQRTYLLTQDPAVPANFGVDELRFDFGDEATAAAFATKLTDNLANCKDRVLTAAVSELTPVEGTGASDVPVSARSFVIDQATSDNASVSYQVSVAIAGQKVSYLLASVTRDFRFTDAELGALALRSAQRLSQ